MTCSFDWDGGGATSTAPVSGGTCSKTNTFTSAGVYSVTVTVTDSTGDTASAIVMIVVFDPKAGFVSGGGTVDSPAGAYIADPNASGSATFGFYSKYRKGAAIPTGETEFLFRTGNFRFRAVKYDWLVVAGARAQFKGTGSVNGVSNYGFLLTVVDGDLTGGGGVDRFRLKVWDKSAADKIVYDNVIGAPDDLEAASPQALTSGSIIIHK